MRFEHGACRLLIAYTLQCSAVALNGAGRCVSSIHAGHSAVPQSPWRNCSYMMASHWRSGFCGQGQVGHLGFRAAKDKPYGVVGPDIHAVHQPCRRGRLGLNRRLRLQGSAGGGLCKAVEHFGPWCIGFLLLQPVEEKRQKPIQQPSCEPENNSFFGVDFPASRMRSSWSIYCVVIRCSSMGKGPTSVLVISPPFSTHSSCLGKHTVFRS